MRLIHPNGCYFALTIEGYQFPELENEEYDLNWLNIAIDVRRPRGHWKAVDPALLTNEAASLAQWFNDLATGRREERDQEFMEPCLSFHVPNDPERDEELVVEFSHEFRPPWASDNLDEPHILVFSMHELDLRAASASLREQLSRYPQRTNV